LGAVQATAAGVAMGVSGVLRDIVNVLHGGQDPAVGYNVVYGFEILLLGVTIAVVAPLIGRASAGTAWDRGAVRDALPGREVAS
jgi:BCD family chlorophyll transporter-like MFS transporter